MEHKAVFSISSQTTLFLVFVRIHSRLGSKSRVKWSSVCHNEGTRHWLQIFLSVFSEACRPSHWANSSNQWVGGPYRLFRVYTFSCRGVLLYFMQISSTVCIVNNTLYPSALFSDKLSHWRSTAIRNRPCMQGIISLIQFLNAPLVDRYPVISWYITAQCSTGPQFPPVLRWRNFWIGCLHSTGSLPVVFEKH